MVSSYCELVIAEHTQDKHIQREEEYYDDDNDNDHEMDDSQCYFGFEEDYWSHITICTLDFLCTGKPIE